jgi:hypothetical protein
MHEQKILVIAHMDTVNHNQTRHCCDFENHEFHPKSCTFQFAQLHFGNGESFDDNGSFLCLYQNNNYIPTHHMTYKSNIGFSKFTFSKAKF